MIKLLRADFRRGIKNVYFRLGLAASLVCGLGAGWITRDMQYIDDVYIMPIFVIISAVISLFIGTEHSDGGIRNKIVSGHKKGGVYLSLLFVSVFFSLLLSSAFFGSFAVLQIGRKIVFPAYALVASAFGFILVCLTFGVISTAVSVINPKKSVSAVCCIITVFATFALCYAVEDVLLNSKFIHIISVESDGTEIEILENNPKYVGGTLRKVLEFLEKANPFGALKKYLFVISGSFNPWIVTLYLSEEKIYLLKILPLYSLFVSLFVGAAGHICFRKKELK